MKDKTFIVENPKTKEQFTIKGKSLEEALEQEMLDPKKWLLVSEPEPAGDEPETE